MRTRETVVVSGLIGAMLVVGSFTATAIAGDDQLVRSPAAYRIHPKLDRYLSGLQPEETAKVWVFFTDKGVFTQDQYQVALRQAEVRLTDRARVRRLRSRSPDDLVDFSDLPVRTDYIERVLAVGCVPRATSRWLNAVSVEATAAQVRLLSRIDFVAELRKVASYRRAQPEVTKDFPSILGGRGLDYGPSIDQLEQINVPPVHDLGYNGEGALICMLDTGFKRSHEAIAGINVLAEWDFIHDDGNTDYDPEQDDYYQPWHGTITLSAIGGFKEGQLIGPAYGADFILGKTEETTFEEPIEEDWWVEGAEWADSFGADVISSSLGYTDWYDFEDMNGDYCVTTIGADEAAQNGIVVCTAMGNEGNYEGSIIAPADADSILGIGAVNREGELARFSSIGPTYDGRIKPEVVALGVDTYAADPEDDNGYLYVNGTSLSTPLVGGLAAIMIGAHPDWSVMQVREALMMTASQAGDPDNYLGWGIPDALLALNYSFAPDVSVELVVDSPTVPRGGTLGYEGILTNNTDESQGVSVWTEVILPNGKPYKGNPILGPIYQALAPFQVRSKHVNHGIPWSAPLGVYTYIAKLGTYPDDVMDQDSFEFEVVVP